MSTKGCTAHTTKSTSVRINTGRVFSDSKQHNKINNPFLK